MVVIRRQGGRITATARRETEGNAVELRRLFTSTEFYAEGHTRAQLRWRVKTKQCVKVHGPVFADGVAEPTPFEQSLARMIATGKPAWGMVAAQLYGFDGVEVHIEKTKRVRRRLVDAATCLVEGIECTSPLQTLLDLASLVDDDVWEQSLEYALFKRLVELADIETLLPSLSKARWHGVGRMRRVLGARPVGAQPTESLLETLMVQVARLVPGLPPPIRQLRLFRDDGVFVARIDLCWPGLGLFIELDGEHHAGQPVYDASRESDVVATTGWLCGRFTWTEVRHHPEATAARLARIVEQARRRPVANVS